MSHLPADQSDQQAGPEVFEKSITSHGRELHVQLVIEEPRWLPLLDEEVRTLALDAALAALSQPRADEEDEAASPAAHPAASARSPRLAILMLSNDETVKSLNAQYRGKDKATNILSFPAEPMDEAEATLFEEEEDDGHIGDCILAIETVTREAEEEGKPFAHHLAHLLIHGVLHLLAYDHEREAEATHMETVEKQILSSFAIKDPYNPMD